MMMERWLSPRLNTAPNRKADGRTVCASLLSGLLGCDNEQTTGKTMNNYEQAEKYLNDRDYKMEVILDNGLHRYLKFTNNGRWDGHFFITTWPNHLCISGDMGTFVFSRIEDMMYFFKGEGVNPSYWSEKIKAETLFGGGYREFNFEKFEKYIKEKLEPLLSEECADYVDKEEVQEALEALESTEEDEYGAVDFMRSLNISGVDSCDWSWDFEEYTFHYLFACHAINFACNTYLAAKPDNEVAA